MPSSIDDKRLDAFVSLSRPAQLQTRNIHIDPNSARTAAIITVYIALSASVDMYNRYIWSTLEFPYPVFLVTSQLVVTALGSTVLLQLPLVDSAHLQTRMSRGIFLRSILPIGILFSGSLFLSNKAYLHLSVSWIQMIKAFVPVAVLLVGKFARITTQDPKKVFAIVFMVSFGVAVASYTSSYALRIFDVLGFGMQALAVMFEASRLVMLEVLLHETKIHPLVALQYSASVCAVFNLIVLAFTEGLDPFLALGPWVLLSNALLAFCQNIAAMYLIDVASGLVLTLTGVLKDVLLVASNVLMFGEAISGVQVVGYSIALGSLVLYNTAK